MDDHNDNTRAMEGVVGGNWLARQLPDYSNIDIDSIDLSWLDSKPAGQNPGPTAEAGYGHLEICHPSFDDDERKPPRPFTQLEICQHSPVTNSDTLEKNQSSANSTPPAEPSFKTMAPAIDAAKDKFRQLKLSGDFFEFVPVVCAALKKYDGDHPQRTASPTITSATSGTASSSDEEESTPEAASNSKFCPCRHNNDLDHIGRRLLDLHVDGAGGMLSGEAVCDALHVRAALEAHGSIDPNDVWSITESVYRSIVERCNQSDYEGCPVHKARRALWAQNISHKKIPNNCKRILDHHVVRGDHHSDKNKTQATGLFLAAMRHANVIKKRNNIPSGKADALFKKIFMIYFHGVFEQGETPLFLYKSGGLKAKDHFPTKPRQLYAYDGHATFGEPTTQTNFFDEKNRGKQATTPLQKITPTATKVADLKTHYPAIKKCQFFIEYEIDLEKCLNCITTPDHVTRSLSYRNLKIREKVNLIEKGWDTPFEWLDDPSCSLNKLHCQYVSAQVRRRRNGGSDGGGDDTSGGDRKRGPDDRPSGSKKQRHPGPHEQQQQQQQEPGFNKDTGAGVYFMNHQAGLMGGTAQIPPNCAFSLDEEFSSDESVASSDFRSDFRSDFSPAVPLRYSSLGGSSVDGARTHDSDHKNSDIPDAVPYRFENPVVLLPCGLPDKSEYVTPLPRHATEDTSESDSSVDQHLEAFGALKIDSAEDDAEGEATATTTTPKSKLQDV